MVYGGCSRVLTWKGVKGVSRKKGVSRGGHRRENHEGESPVKEWCDSAE